LIITKLAFKQTCQVYKLLLLKHTQPHTNSDLQGCSLSNWLWLTASTLQ